MQHMGQQQYQAQECVDEPEKQADYPDLQKAMPRWQMHKMSQMRREHIPTIN